MYHASADENTTVGTEVLKLLATSRDSGVNAEISYSIIGGNEHNMFQINPRTGERNMFQINPRTGEHNMFQISPRTCEHADSGSQRRTEENTQTFLLFGWLAQRWIL